MPLYLALQFYAICIIAEFLFSRRRHDDVVIPAKAGIHSFIFSPTSALNAVERVHVGFGHNISATPHLINIIVP